MNAGITSPSLIREALAKKGKKISDNAITMMITRMGVDRKAIAETVRLERSKDIIEHQRVKDYLSASSTSGITKAQQDRQLQCIQQIWEWMGKTAPEGWTYERLMACMKEHYEFGEDEETGRLKFKKQGAVSDHLSAVNTMFPMILHKGWSTGFNRDKGELKDRFSFEEFNAFINALEDTENMSLLGWRANYKSQVNMGAREGRGARTGILSLRWENIDYEKRRCSLREKGGKGKAARLWKNLPLDFFPWIHGWDDLVSYHVQQFGYEPSNTHHAEGLVFPVRYDQYLTQFHATRKAAGGRIAVEESDTLKPHILRKTHAQWCKKLRIPLEQICGQFPNGRNGVGWDNPKILLDFYVDIEDDEYEEADEKAKKRMETLGLVSSTAIPLPLSNETSAPQAATPLITT